jgi:hypothetical protein
MNQPTAGYGIVHLIAANGLPVPFLKCVLVTPFAIWAGDLLIDKPERRFPNGDFGPPPEGDTMQTQTVFYQRTTSHLDRGGRQNGKVQPRRGNLFELISVREEIEDPFSRGRDGQGYGQPVSARFSWLAFDLDHRFFYPFVMNDYRGVVRSSDKRM